MAEKRATELSGQVTMSHSFLLYLSACQYLVVAVPIGLIAIFSPTPFVIGGILAIGFMFILHAFWIGRYRSKKRKAGNARKAGDEKDGPPELPSS